MIGIIGSGLAGLTAAKVLNEKGLGFQVIEASDRIGGRVKTDEIEGFLLDHGFQVLLTSYPQVQKHLHLDELNLGSFSPGARIYANGITSIISDPLREPAKVFSTLFSPLTTIGDSLRILKLKSHEETSDSPTIDLLKNIGFTEKFITSFFKPFFTGIFLEKNLKTPANYFSFLFNRFSKGVATLPAEGMQAVPKQLAKNFQDKVKLNSIVTQINESESGVSVTLESGETLIFDKVIVATEAPQTASLFPELGLETSRRVVTTVYFHTDELPYNDKYLFLNGSGKGRVNHIAFLSQVAPHYSPQGKHLISVNVIDIDPVDPEKIKEEIKSWGTLSIENWQHLATYPINYAQPDSFSQGNKNFDKERIVFAGDFTQTPSIEGSMKSGELAANKLAD